MKTSNDDNNMNEIIPDDEISNKSTFDVEKQKNSFAYRAIKIAIPFAVVYFWNKIKYGKIDLFSYFFMVAFLLLGEFLFNVIIRNIKKRKRR